MDIVRRWAASLVGLWLVAASTQVAAQGDPAAASFARAAARSAATGAALARTARAESLRVRDALADAAEARAQRAGVLIAAPLGLCFLPAFLVLGVAPVVTYTTGGVLYTVEQMGGLAKQLPEGPEAEAQMRQIEAIISSMTKAERGDPGLMNASRRRRIAAGSGTTVADVNQLIKQFAEMQKVMKQMGGMAKSGRLPRIPGMPRLG